MASRDDLQRQLEKGVKQLELDISDKQLNLLLDYIELFDKWNRAYNLSAIRDISEMVSRHLLDSLAVMSHVKAYFDTTDAQRFIDVGTGGGLPGIPLAIMFPEKSFTLLDSNGKKTRFLFQVKTELKLTNVTVENNRVEKYQPTEPFDGVISRAFASIKDMTDGCAHFLKSGGYFWAMKGIYPVDELAAVEKNYTVADSHRLQVPGSDGERHLLLIQPLNHSATCDV
jgi:16S rRNA (guanine527-N7)-methyltransferase